MKRLARSSALFALFAPFALWACGDAEEESIDTGATDRGGVHAASPSGEAAVRHEPTVIEPREGLLVETVRPGSGPGARIGDRLTVHYEGRLGESGDVFESSYGSGIPYRFTLGAKEVIPAWEIALQGVRAGSNLKLTVPPALAYGEEGMGRVPPDAALEFEIHVVRID